MRYTLLVLLAHICCSCMEQKSITDGLLDEDFTYQTALSHSVHSEQAQQAVTILAGFSHSKTKDRENNAEQAVYSQASKRVDRRKKTTPKRSPSTARTKSASSA